MLISLDGPEATGKSTIAKALAEKLEADGHNVLLTKEPGSNDPVCRKIRELLLNPEHKVEDMAALFLFLADRSQHMKAVIEALKRGQIVISDRSSLSTYVYHTATMRDYISVGDDWLFLSMDQAAQRAPDLTLIFRASLSFCAEQLRERGALDRIESFDEDFHKRTHSLFQLQKMKIVARNMRFGPRKLVEMPRTDLSTKEELLDFAYKNVAEVMNGK